MTDLLDWRPFAPFGVEVFDDLAEPLTKGQGEHLRELLWEHGVVVARDQDLTMERQRELCGLLGPVLLREGENGYMVNEAGHIGAVSPLAWHADAAYTNAPFDAIALHAIDVVEGASSTRFADAAAALHRLSPALRKRLRAARVEMISPGMDMLAGRTCDTRDPVALKRSEQPGVFKNPHNHREVVWVSELQAARVLGMEWEESRDLLHAVYDELYDEDWVFEHKWRNGDLVIWDNIGTQHTRGNLEHCGRRVLQRVIVGTSGVIPTIAEPGLE